MAPFKGALIRDPNTSPTRLRQSLCPEGGITSNFPHQEVESYMDKDDDDLLDIDEAALPKCEKFENLYLIGKMLGESVSLKTIMSKSKSDWMPIKEVNIFTWVMVLFLLRLLMKWIAIMCFLINPGLVKDRFSIYEDGDRILIPSKNLSNGL